MVAQTITKLDLIPSDIPIRLYCDQGDCSTAGSGRLFSFVLQKEQSNYYPASGATATVEGTKPNGSTFSHSVSMVLNMVSVYLHEDMTDTAGTVKMQVVVREGNNRTGSQMIHLFVQRSAYDNTGI